jgi:DNA-binding NtrC family response regulator
MNSTVLLVAEDSFFLQNLSGSLKCLNTFVMTAGNKHEALEVCANHPVDLALLDIRRLDKDAMQILARLKKAKPETEVILLSGPDNIAVAIEGMRQGASDDITIPCDIAVLHQKVKNALRRIRERAETRKKRSLLDIFEDTMVAATFAQAGEFETALKIKADSGTNSIRKKGVNQSSKQA